MNFQHRPNRTNFRTSLTQTCAISWFDLGWAGAGGVKDHREHRGRPSGVRKKKKQAQADGGGLAASPKLSETAKGQVGAVAEAFWGRFCFQLFYLFGHIKRGPRRASYFLSGPRSAKKVCALPPDLKTNNDESAFCAACCGSPFLPAQRHQKMTWGLRRGTVPHHIYFKIHN